MNLKSKSVDQGKILAGLDLGTTKVSACMGRTYPDGSIEITGIGTRPSSGVRHGMVVNIEATVEAVRSAIQEAESMAGEKMNGVNVAIGGAHIKCVNSQGNAAIRDGEVSASILDLALESAIAIPLSNDEKIIHVIPQEYAIDWQEGIREPRGMSGTRLDANVHVVICAKNAVSNVAKCVGLCGLDIQDIVVEPIAAAASVLTDEEKELGVCLLDIGGGTTDVAVYTNGSLRHTEIIPIAGDSVTRDIAMTFRTPAQHAEQVKIKYACALQELTDETESIKVPGLADRPATQIPRQMLASVVESRYRELYNLVHNKLLGAKISKAKLGSGVILTGGAATMEGAAELAEEIFHLPVSSGKPKNLQGLNDLYDNSAYSTCTGLLVYASRRKRGWIYEPRETRNGFKFSWRAIRSWLHKTYKQI